MSRIFITPLARMLAETANLDIAQITGSGPDNRIIKRDVEAAIAGGDTRPPVTPQAAIPDLLPDARLYFQTDDYTEMPLSDVQTAIAKRLSQAKQQLPHFYLTRKLAVDEMLTLRQRFNKAIADDTPKLTVNDFIIRAVALALMDIPEINVSFTDTAILRHHHADIGVAVALDEGLITPIVQRAEERSLTKISAHMRELVALAREKRLKPAQYEGGSFSISNLGMFDIEHFTAIINPPQAAILAVGSTVHELSRTQDETIIERQVMRVTLSCDHRAINGATGAQFLQTLADYIENPMLLAL